MTNLDIIPEKLELEGRSDKRMRTKFFFINNSGDKAFRIKGSILARGVKISPQSGFIEVYLRNTYVVHDCELLSLELGNIIQAKTWGGVRVVLVLL